MGKTQTSEHHKIFIKLKTNCEPMKCCLFIDCLILCFRRMVLDIRLNKGLTATDTEVEDDAVKSAK